MITAAAPAFLRLRPSVTSVSGRRDVPPAQRRLVTCGYAAKVTIYNCRNEHRIRRKQVLGG